MEEDGEEGRGCAVRWFGGNEGPVQAKRTEDGVVGCCRARTSPLWTSVAWCGEDVVVVQSFKIQCH